MIRGFNMIKQDLKYILVNLSKDILEKAENLKTASNVLDTDPKQTLFHANSLNFKLIDLLEYYKVKLEEYRNIK